MSPDHTPSRPSIRGPTADATYRLDSDNRPDSVAIQDRRVHTRGRVVPMTVRVTTLKGADAGLYYVEALPSYYLDAGEPAGVWHGLGAEPPRAWSARSTTTPSWP